MVEELVAAGATLASAGVVYVMAAARVVKQYERGVVFRLGRLRDEVRGPGFTMIVPFVDRLQKVNMQVVTMPVPAYSGPPLSPPSAQTVVWIRPETTSPPP